MLIQFIHYLNSFIWGNQSLYSFEKICIDEWMKHLSLPAREILSRQIKAFDYVQRQSKGKLVCFFSLKDPQYQTWSSDCLYPTGHTDIIAASIYIRAMADNRKKPLRANMTVFQGRFYSIEFSQRPIEYFGRKRIPATDLEVVKVNVLIDLMEKELFAVKPLQDKSNLKGWIRKLAEENNISGLREPLALPVRQKIINQLDINFPSDYLDIINQTEGISIRTFIKVLGLLQVRTLVLPLNDMSFYILCEIEGKGALGIKQENNVSELFYLDNEIELPQKTNLSFREFIEQELRLSHNRNL